ncbi:MAG: phosphotransferase, partial [Deinococcus sp.]
MTSQKMHAEEVETDVSLVRRLLAGQFPQWAGLPVRPVRSAGTDNAIYRLGDDLAVRLPRIGWAVEDVSKDYHWLSWLAPRLPLPVPLPLALGVPGEGYPFPWAVYRWLPGEEANMETVRDPRELARDLAGFVTALRAI